MEEDKSVPILPGLPIIGNFPEFRRDRLDLLMKVHRECGNGLLTALNEDNRRNRKIMAPIFQHKEIGHLAEVMAACTETMQARWKDGARIDVAHEMMELTLWIVGKTLFGADLLGEAKEPGEAMSEGIEYGNEQYSAMIHIPYDWPTPSNERARRAVNRINDTMPPKGLTPIVSRLNVRSKFPKMPLFPSVRGRVFVSAIISP